MMSYGREFMKKRYGFDMSDEDSYDLNCLYTFGTYF